MFFSGCVLLFVKDKSSVQFPRNWDFRLNKFKICFFLLIFPFLRFHSQQCYVGYKGPVLHLSSSCEIFLSRRPAKKYPIPKQTIGAKSTKLGLESKQLYKIV